MNVIEVLERDAEDAQAEARRLRETADQLTVDAYKKRAKADTLELAAVESRAAANLLRQAGFRADRTEDGVPRISVDRAVSEPDATPQETP